MITDVRFALRVLAKTPALTLVALLSLALGIGANTALFGLLDRWVLRPADYPESQRLVNIWRSNTRGGWEHGQLSPFMFQQIQQATASFESAAAVGIRSVNVSGVDEPYSLDAARVSRNLFDVLGVRPEAGRLRFTEDEERTGGPKVAVLTHKLWMNRFGGDPAITGRTVILNGESSTIIGILPRGYRAPTNRIRGCQIYVPTAFTTAELDPGNGVDYELVARLKRDRSLVQANEELKALALHFGWSEGFSLYANGLSQELGSSRRSLLLALQGAVGLVLLIACVNVANLLLVKGLGREHEMAIRTALGAGRGALLRQLLVESLLLALGGGLLGLLLSRWMTLGFSRMQGLGLSEGVPLNEWVLIFTAGISLFTSLLFGLLPAWQASRVAPSEALKNGTRSMASVTRHSLKSCLAVVEIALATALTVGAGLLLHSLYRQYAEGPGFRSKGVLVASIALPGEGFQAQTSFLRNLENRMRTFPGVQEAALCTPMPLVSAGGEGPVRSEGQVPSSEVDAWHHYTTPGFFSAMGIPILQGRTFQRDERDACVISRQLAASLWPGQDPAGHRLLAGGGSFTVVGVAEGTKEFGLDEPLRPQFFLPMGLPGTQPIPNVELLVKVTGDPMLYSKALKQTMKDLKSDIPVEPARLDDVVAASAGQLRDIGFLFGAFASLALTLALLGVHGVLSFMAVQRYREIGIRMALGASMGKVLRMVLSHGLVLVGTGLLGGIFGAVALSRFIQHWMYGVSGLDPSILLFTSILLFLAGLLASLGPALRAASVDPARVLRGE